MKLNPNDVAARGGPHPNPLPGGEGAHQGAANGAGA
jgi:hypothetical protein